MNVPIIIIFPFDYTYDEIEELKNSSVDILIFDEHFKGDLCNFEFPDTIFYLEINSNCSLTGVNLPKNLKKLKFGSNFNLSLDNVELPNSLEILEFVNYNNSLFSVKLPKTLKKIKNKICKEVFLNTANLLNGPNKFEIFTDLYSLPFFLPPNVKNINLGSQYNYRRNAFVFPKTLKKLTINGEADNEIIFNEMHNELENLTSLTILENLDFSIKKLPEKIKKLKLPYNYNNTKISINLPIELEHLTLSGNTCNELLMNYLPTKIKSLEIINNLDFDLKNLPLSLNTIYLNFIPSKKKIINLHSNIKKVIFSDEFNCSIPVIILDKNLEYLRISGKKFNKNIINNLPDNLQSLEIVDDLEFELTNLPFSLTELYINVFNKKITIIQSNLPSTLKRIKIFKSYSEKYFKISFGCELILLDD